MYAEVSPIRQGMRQQELLPISPKDGDEELSAHPERTRHHKLILHTQKEQARHALRVVTSRVHAMPISGRPDVPWLCSI